MTVETEQRRRHSDNVLRRMPVAAWRTLPVLLACGAGITGVFVVSGVLIGWGNPLVPVLTCVVGAPLVLRGVERVHAELFEQERGTVRRSWGMRTLRVGSLLLPAGLTSALAMLAGHAALLPGGSLFAAVGVVGVLMAALLAVIAVVAVPLCVVRPEARIGSIVLVAFYASVRRPIAAVAVLASAIALSTAAASGLPALAALTPSLTIVLAIAAAWTTLGPAGVEVPALQKSARLSASPEPPES